MPPTVLGRELYSYQPPDQSQALSRHSGHGMTARYHPPRDREDAHAGPSFQPATIPPAPWTSGKPVSPDETVVARVAQSRNGRLLTDHVDTSTPSYPVEQVSEASRGTGQTFEGRPAVTPHQIFPPSTSRHYLTPNRLIVDSDAPFFNDPGSMLVQPSPAMQNGLGNEQSCSHITYPAESVDWSSVTPVHPSALTPPRWGVDYKPLGTEAVPDLPNFPAALRAGFQPSDLNRNSYFWTPQAVSLPDLGQYSVREYVPPLIAPIMAKLIKLFSRNSPTTHITQGSTVPLTGNSPPADTWLRSGGIVRCKASV